MKTNVILTINDTQYEILRCGYSFKRRIDSKGRPSSGVMGGDIWVELESEEKNKILSQMLLEKAPPVKGSISVLSGEDERCIRKIVFEKAYVYSHTESFTKYSPRPIMTGLRITPVRMDIGETVKIDRRWPETSGFHWKEYKVSTNESRVMTEEIESEPEIVSVEIIDEENNPLSGEVIQFVNLKKESRFVDGVHVAGLHQLGNVIRCKVKFNKVGSHNFSIKLVPDGVNISYSDAEKGRKVNFKRQEAELSLTTNNNGEIIIEGSNQLFLDQAGGNIYKVSATDDTGKIVESGASIKTIRKAYYVEVKMTGLTSIASSLATFERAFSDNQLKLSRYATANIAHIENIGDGNTEISAFKASVNAAYNSHNTMDPYAIAIAYTDHLAVKRNLPIRTLSPVPVGVGQSNITLPIRASTRGTIHALWNNIVSGDDWFVSGVYTDSRGGVTIISKTICTPRSTQGFGSDYLDAIEVDVSALPSGSGIIVLTVDVVDRMRGGLSFGGTNIVAVCTRAWWNNKINADQNQVMIHEVGHKVGMVPDGTPAKPLDKPANYYDNSQGHVGTHCRAGISNQPRYDGSSDRTASTCVMYGSTNGITAFCPDCAICVTKTDISNGTNY